MNRIKDLRVKKGLTQSELAEMLNIAQNTLSYWEAGKTEPNGEALIKLADFFGTTIDNLLGRETETYQNDEDLDEILEALHKRPEMKTRFSISRKATREDIETAMKIIEALKKEDEE